MLACGLNYTVELPAEVRRLGIRKLARDDVLNRPGRRAARPYSSFLLLPSNFTELSTSSIRNATIVMSSFGGKPAR